MRYAALAADYDGTLASQGLVATQTMQALQRFGSAGRKLILVTGRELDELLGIFPQIAVFDRVVAENGALLFCPRSGIRKPLASAPPPEFVAELRRRGVQPLSVGHCIVATVTPNETPVLETIRDLGLELQVIFNKGAVMVLPAGVNKASGLKCALDDLHLSARNVVAIGDAENDHALLRSAEYGIAVGNALPTLKQAADRASALTHGAAVVEAIDAMLVDDLRTLASGQPRRRILLGRRADGSELNIAPAGCDLLVAGASGSGKSVYAAGVLERAAEQGYQYCIIDPEGDYASMAGAVVFGSAQAEPTAAELMTALESPATNVVVNLAGLSVQDRPAAFKHLLPRLHELRATLGRPHWMLVGEAHRLYPGTDPDAVLAPQEARSSMIYVTVHPDRMAPSVLASAGVVLGMGPDPASVLAAYCAALQIPGPGLIHCQPTPGEALAWLRAGNEAPFVLRLQPSEAEHRQRKRKHEADLPPERSFYFRGARKKLNLRAQNLPLFMQIGSGVDDQTWLHHLNQGDYSRWLRETVEAAELADSVERIERGGGSAALTRGRIQAAILAFMEAATEPRS